MTKKEPSVKKRAIEFGSGLWVDMMKKLMKMEKSAEQQVQIKQENKMNKLMRVAALAVFVSGLGYSAVSFAADDAFVAAQDHATLAGLYEKKAAEQNSLINQHERMKVDSGWLKQQVNFSASAMAERARHCDAIIAKTKDLKAELLSAAEWHKKQ